MLPFIHPLFNRLFVPALNLNSTLVKSALTFSIALDASCFTPFIVKDKDLASIDISPFLDISSVRTPASLVTVNPFTFNLSAVTEFVAIQPPFIVVEFAGLPLDH